MNVRRNWALVGVCCAALAIAACHRPEMLGGKPSAPTGEVVAKVDGHEITLRQLQAELQGVRGVDPKQMKAVQARALELIVMRTLLSDAARKQGVDKSPDFVMQRDRMVDNLLAQMLQDKTARAVPAPSPEEIDRFISDHADIFARRKVYAVDQIRFARPADPAIVKGLEPLDTLDQIASYLTSKDIKWARGDARVDVVGLDPRIVEAIGKVPQNAPWVLAGGSDVLLVNQIKSVDIVPLSGAAATTYATALLTRQHAQEAVQRETQQVVSAGMKRVAYNPAYAPPAPPRAPPATNSVASPSNAAGAP